MLLWGVRMKFSVSIETQSQDEKSFMIQRFQTGKNKIFDRAYRHLACTGLYHLCIAWLTHVFQNSLCDNTVGEKAERSCDNTVPHTSNIMPRVFYLHNAMILWNRSRDMLFFHKFTNRWIILVFHSRRLSPIFPFRPYIRNTGLTPNFVSHHLSSPKHIPLILHSYRTREETNTQETVSFTLMRSRMSGCFSGFHHLLAPVARFCISCHQREVFHPSERYDFWFKTN
jgi:hypothetical protein